METYRTPVFSSKRSQALSFSLPNSLNKLVLLLLLLITRPLPRDGGMAEDHGASESGKLPIAWTRGPTETESRQRLSGAKSP